MTLGSEFWSAIAGAIVGGVIAFGIQMVAIRAAGRERQEDKKEVQKALGLSAMFKTMRIHSNLFHLHHHLEEAYGSVESGAHSEPWSFVLPLANTLDDVHFSEHEMAFALSLKDDDLSDKLMSLDLIHNSLIDVFDSYRDMRGALLEQMPPVTMQGNVGTSELHGTEALRLRPKMVEMNLLVEDARKRAKMDYEESREVVEKLRDVLNAKVGLDLKLEFKQTLLQT